MYSFIEDYLEDLTSTLQFWYDLHTDRDTWVDEWLMGEDAAEYVCTYGRTVENAYFTADILDLALQRYANAECHNWYECDNCGALNEYGGDYCSCMYDEELEEEPDLLDVDPKELYDWLDELYSYDDEALLNLVWFHVEDAVRIDVFDIYRDALSPYTCEIEAEIEEALEALEDAKGCEDEAEFIAAVNWCNHVAHVNGDIVHDYGTEDLYRTVQEISDNGYMWMDTYSGDYPWLEELEDEMD